MSDLANNVPDPPRDELRCGKLQIPGPGVLKSWHQFEGATQPFVDQQPDLGLPVEGGMAELTASAVEAGYHSLQLCTNVSAGL